MTDRTIFPNLKLFKKEVTERFLIALREIFKKHPVYVYNDDEMATGIYLYPAYADLKIPGKKPKILIKTGGYAFGLNDTIFNNMAAEAVNAAGLISGFTYNKMMTTSVTAMVQAYAEEEASDLADEFTMLTVFACRKMYSMMGLVIRGAQVSETDVIDTNAGIYQTVVSIGLDFPWGATVTDNSPPINDIELDIPDTEAPFPVFREPPGIEVYRKKVTP